MTEPGWMQSQADPALQALKDEAMSGPALARSVRSAGANLRLTKPGRGTVWLGVVDHMAVRTGGVKQEIERNQFYQDATYGAKRVINQGGNGP